MSLHVENPRPRLRTPQSTDFGLVYLKDLCQRLLAFRPQTCQHTRKLRNVGREPGGRKLGGSHSLSGRLAEIPEDSLAPSHVGETPQAHGHVSPVGSAYVLGSQVR